MPELLYQIALWFDLITGVGITVLGLFGRKPADLMAALVGLTELLLLVQLVAGFVSVAQGGQAKGDTVEYFIYVIVALLIPPAAILWAILDRASRWSTVVLGVVGITLAIMLVRMHQIWFGA
ncbi:MAG: hypothetical protein RJA35_442 [Actinomycetota bacterium]|jgi:hypothetical protein